MRGTVRTLVILAVVFGAAALLCMIAPGLAPSSYSQSDLMRPEILTAGLAEVVRVPATSFALLCAIGAVFVRGLTWRPRRTARMLGGGAPIGEAVRGQREP